MFGIGLPELAVIAFFGVILMGPDKLPGLAKQLAQGIRSAKRMGDSVRDDLRSSLGDDYADLELRDLNPREMVRRQVMEVLAERDEDERDDEDDDGDQDDDETDDVDVTPLPVPSTTPDITPSTTPAASPERKTA